MIQGSKLSGILYIIYVKEVPRIHELLRDKSVMQYLADHEKPEVENIDHHVYNFVVDSNSALSSTSIEDLNKYITAYLHLLMGYYKMNRLKIN